MKILGYPNPSAATIWRFEDPFKYLRKSGIDAVVINNGIQENDLLDADAIVVKGLIDKSLITLLYAHQQENGLKIVVDMDDDIRVDESNPHIIEHKLANSYDVTKTLLGIADMVTVTTEYLANRMREYNSNVVVLENYIDLERWDIQPKLKNDSDRIRIGWAGSITHIKDLQFIEEPLTRICNEHPEVELVFVGELRNLTLFGGCRKFVQYGVPMDAWPQKLSGLRLDIGLAPLIHNDFNKCKSRIKHYEYAINMIPGIYSPTVYDEQHFDGYFGLIAPDKERWYACLRNMIQSKELREDIANSAYGFVKRHKSLEKHIGEWVEAYNRLFDTR